MPFVLTSNAILMCPHGGHVQVIPQQFKVLAGGAPVLRVIDLEGAPIIGCPVPPTPATVPCTAVDVVTPTSTVLVLGEPVLVDPVVALTDGVPPGPVTVIEPGQAIVQAN